MTVHKYIPIYTFFFTFIWLKHSGYPLLGVHKIHAYYNFGACRANRGNGNNDYYDNNNIDENEEDDDADVGIVIKLFFFPCETN